MEVGAESPSSFLERKVFEILLPGLEETLKVAKNTERRKRFNALDYLVEYLYRNNPTHQDREVTCLRDIPFVQEEWKKNPRPPLPLSATLTEDQAATIIQATYRGHLVRKQGNAKLFRRWKKEVAKERSAVMRLQKKWRAIVAAKKFISRASKHFSSQADHSPSNKESTAQNTPTETAPNAENTENK